MVRILERGNVLFTTPCGLGLILAVGIIILVYKKTVCLKTDQEKFSLTWICKFTLTHTQMHLYFQHMWMYNNKVKSRNANFYRKNVWQ